MSTKIPKGWRRMKLTEVIRKGDKFYNEQETVGPLGWTPSLSEGFTPGHNVSGAPYIRRIPKKRKSK